MCMTVHVNEYLFNPFSMLNFSICFFVSPILGMPRNTIDGEGKEERKGQNKSVLHELPRTEIVKDSAL